MDHLEVAWQIVAKGMDFLSDLMTVAVGAITFYGLIWHRKEFMSFLKLIATSHMHERMKRIKETLGKLEFLNYDVKENRAEIFALSGQLSGQIRPLISQIPALDIADKEMTLLLSKESKLSEPTKRRILYEIHGALDSEALASSTSLLGACPNFITFAQRDFD